MTLQLTTHLPTPTRPPLSTSIITDPRSPTAHIPGPESEDWHTAEAAKIDRLLANTTMHAIHLHQQPSDRRGDTTYYNPKNTTMK